MRPEEIRRRAKVAAADHNAMDLKISRQGIIITGGSIDEEWALRFFSQYQTNRIAQNLIAADRGIEFCRRHGIRPGHIMGDFDSADPSALAWFTENGDVDIRRYPPEKDWTDTELAVRTGIELGWNKIIILGGTGTRLDHMLGNLQTMELALEQGVEVQILDPHNRVRMIREDLELSAEDLSGDYISLVPWGGPAVGVTLRGFKYEITDRTLQTDEALAISNECTSPQVHIRLKAGRLLVIESSD